MPAVAVAAHEQYAIALDALGDVEGKFEAVTTEGAGGEGAVDGGAAVVAENGGGGGMAELSGGEGYGGGVEVHG